MSELWWLSFCDPTLPKGSQFLGACIVPGENIAHAMMSAWLMGCNPGGEIVGNTFERHTEIYPIGVLMSREDIDELEKLEPTLQ